MPYYTQENLVSLHCKVLQMYTVLLYVCSPFNLIKINPSQNFG